MTQQQPPPGYPMVAAEQPRVSTVRIVIGWMLLVIGGLLLIGCLVGAIAMIRSGGIALLPGAGAGAVIMQWGQRLRSGRKLSGRARSRANRVSR